MSFLVNFWLGLGNPRHIATKSQHLWAVPRQIKFWSILKKKLGLGQIPAPPPWAKFLTFTENLFLGLPLVPMDCDVHCLLTEVENFSTDFGHVRSFGPSR